MIYILVDVYIIVITTLVLLFSQMYAPDDASDSYLYGYGILYAIIIIYTAKLVFEIYEFIKQRRLWKKKET